jgi:hypothetical protein
MTTRLTTIIRARHRTADEAYVTGDFNRWRHPGTRMLSVRPGLWEVEVSSEWMSGHAACAFLARGRLLAIVAVSSGSESADSTLANQVPTEGLCRPLTQSRGLSATR